MHTSLPTLTNLQINDPLPTPKFVEKFFQGPLDIIPTCDKLYPRTQVCVNMFNESFFYNKVIEFQESFPGQHGVSTDQGTSAPGTSLPSRPLEVLSGRRRSVVPEVQNVLMDMQSGPIPVLKQRLNQAYPECTYWDLLVADDRTLPEGFYLLNWTTDGDQTQVCPARGSAATVMVVEPWILSSVVLQALVSKRGFFRSPPRQEKYFAEVSWELQDTIWSIVYDYCSRAGTRWWVLTTYEEWVFGVFSTGQGEEWSNVVISPIMSYKALAPTVMQSLLYWLESAVHDGRPNYGYEPPNAPTEPFPTAFSFMGVAEDDDNMPINGPSLSKPRLSVQNRLQRNRFKDTAKPFGMTGRSRKRGGLKPAPIRTGLFEEREHDENSPGDAPVIFYRWDEKREQILSWLGENDQGNGDPFSYTG